MLMLNVCRQVAERHDEEIEHIKIRHEEELANHVKETDSAMGELCHIRAHCQVSHDHFLCFISYVICFLKMGDG